MPTGSDLRDLFHGADGSGPGLDAGRIIRRARRRRTPRVVAVTAGALLVVAAVVVPVAGIGLSRGGAASSAGSVPDPSRSDLGTGGRSEGMKTPAAPPRDACAAPTPALARSAIDLSLDAGEAAVGAPVSGTLVLTATGEAREVRVTGPVALTVQTADGTVVWSGTTDLGSPTLSLAGGAEARLPFTVRVLDCESGSVLPAGDYRIAASAPVSIDGAPAIRVGDAGALRIG